METFNELLELRTMMLQKATIAENIICEILRNDGEFSNGILEFKLKQAENEMELAMLLFKEFQSVWKKSIEKGAQNGN